MTDQNSILKGGSPQSEPHENKTKIHDLTRPGSNPRPLACKANDVPIRHRCIRGAYLRRKLVSLKRIPATKKPLVKNFEPHNISFRAVPINTDKETENKFLVFGPVKMLQEHQYISFILSSEVHNDEASHFSG